MKNQAFTLIEILVVVLIIGILAAIAVPQYQLAVGKSKLATIKDKTRAIAEAEELYYLQNGTYTDNPTELDVDFPGVRKSDDYNSFFFDDGTDCYLWKNEGMGRCGIKIDNKNVYYYRVFNKGLYNPGKQDCLAYSVDKTDIVNRVCQNDTGKTADQAICGDTYCAYYY